MTSNAGPLVIIGGAEDTRNERPILREFVRLTGGTGARLVIFPVASNFPDAASAHDVDVFRALGVEPTEVAPLASRGEANDPDCVHRVEAAGGVFLTGGDQIRITSLLGGTALETALHRGRRSGLVIAGTSAGAAMMSEAMLTAGTNRAPPRFDAVEKGPGFGFPPGVLIDQHVSERGRLGRPLAGLCENPAQPRAGHRRRHRRRHQGSPLSRDRRRSRHRRRRLDDDRQQGAAVRRGGERRHVRRHPPHPADADAVRPRIAAPPGGR